MNKEELIKKADFYKEELRMKKTSDKESFAKLEEELRCNYVWTSNALDGNQMSLEDTRTILNEEGLIFGKSIKDYYEVTGHAAAFDHMHKAACKKKFVVTEAFLKKLHRLYYKGIDGEMAGKYRDTQVYSSDMKFMPPSTNEIVHLMNHFINQIESSVNTLHPIEYAVNCHKRILDIQPFSGGNGQIARLLMNMILIHYGYGPALLREDDRQEYLDGIILARKEGNVDLLIYLITRSLISTQESTLA